MNADDMSNGQRRTCFYFGAYYDLKIDSVWPSGSIPALECRDSGFDLSRVNVENIKSLFNIGSSLNVLGSVSRVSCLLYIAHNTSIKLDSLTLCMSVKYYYYY